MIETSEIGKAWIIWRYIRSDFWARIFGGLIEGECLICGKREKLKLGRWGIWFPPKNLTRHPKRDYFIAKHLHPKIDKQNRFLWAIPLKNL